MVEKSKKKKVKKVVNEGVAHINASFNNTIVTITDNDDAPSVSISGNNNVSEDQNLTITVTLASESGKSVSIDLETTDVQAIAGQDFQALNETITFANQLNKKTGASWIDAPVSGGPDKALEGNLAIMVGGNEEVVEYVKPILEEISSKFTYFGETGSGQIVKMINQIIVLNNYAI